MPKKKKQQDDVARWMVAEHETTIDAPPERVWRALVEEIGRWWTPGFWAMPETKGMRLEPVVGGRLYEWADDGSALVWFTVIGLRPGRSLDLSGHLSPAFGGPATALLRLEVEPKGAVSVVKVQESHVGNVAAGAATSVKKGWTTLLDNGLKPYVERS
jgi:uncharacterized protein YndB with AHSA1/START domain